MPSELILRHNIKILGRGTRPLLFAHGLACDQNVWREVTGAFEKDYKIILFDYIGSGKSDFNCYSKEKYSSLQGYADDVINIIESLSLTDTIFVGHSVSSMIGLLAATKKPSLFSNLIMIGPSPCYINDSNYFGGFERDEIEELLDLMRKNYENWATVFAPSAMGNSDRPELAQNLKDSFCVADPAITYDFARVTFFSDNRNDLKFLKTPSLILQISDDIIAPKVVGEYVQNHTPGSTLYYMKAMGHFPQLSAPEETIDLIKKYLGRIN